MSTPLPVVSVSPPAENVYRALARWAGRADRRLLASWAVVGWLDAAGLAVLLPRLWLLALPFVCVSALGAWGLATQRLRALEPAGGSGARKQALLAVRAAAVTIGTVAAIAAFYAAFLLAMGPRAGGPDG